MTSRRARLAPSADPPPPVFWALVSTVYWAGVAALFALSYGSFFALLGGAGVFVLLIWLCREGAAEWPRRSTWILAAASAIYVWIAVMAFGLAAFIESHGCATAPAGCSGSSLAWPIAGGSLIVYFLICWATLRSRRNVR